MVSPSTAPDLLADFMRAAILEARLIGSLTEGSPRGRRGTGQTEVLYAYRVLDLIHNAPLQMFADHGYETWPDGRLITGPEAALVDIVRLLPDSYGRSTQDDLVLDWADRTLGARGLSVHALYTWAAPLIHRSRDYTNRPR